MKSIKQKLNDGRLSSNDHIRQIVEPMQAKFEKYWNNMKSFAAVALVFDPRFKMQLFDFLLPQQLGLEDAEVSVKEI